MPAWIADETFVFLHPGGHRTAGRVAIGMPRVMPEGEARCAVHIDGIDYGGGDGIAGETTLQALCLAMRFAGYQLHDFVQRGGVVRDESDEYEVNLDHWFGPLLCAPPPRRDEADPTVQ